MKRTFESMCGFRPREYELEVVGPLYKYVNENAPRAVKGLSNWFGIAVWTVAGCGDECIAAWNSGDSYTGAHRHAIHSSPAGRLYIKKGGSRYYLDEFMAI